MKTVIVFFSKFGNTKRVAQAVAETMKELGDARVIGIDELAAPGFEGVDLVVMGSPTHAFSLPEAVRTLLTALPPGILAGKSVAAFDTSVRMWPFRLMTAAPKLLRQLRRLGGRPVVRPQTFCVQTRNPQKTGEVDLLLAGQIERAREWAGKIVKRLKT
jgi:flavodoxin